MASTIVRLPLDINMVLNDPFQGELFLILPNARAVFSPEPQARHYAGRLDTT
nr:hypothetical protein [uncultured Lichenicoccus sp.]